MLPPCSNRGESSREGGRQHHRSSPLGWRKVGEQIFGLTRFREDPIVPPHKHIARSSGPAPPMLGWETAHGEYAPFRRPLTGRSCFLIPSSATSSRSAARQPRGEGTS